jgi:monovalent cation/hydrogen antiporter
MHESELLFLVLMVAIAGLSVLAGAVGVPYPILLVVGGLVLGFVPGLPDIELAPEIVLVLFLPPLLYHAAFFSSPRDLRADARAISLLAVGLVLATMLVVAAIGHLAGGLTWAAAFALGAIVSPTDPLAATTIARRSGVPRRLVTLLEGESLVNDAAALVSYRIAVSVAAGGTFVLWQAGLRLVASAAGGVVVGLVVGRAITWIRKQLDDPPVEIVVTLVTGYIAYVPAEQLGVSGVLAAVFAGLYVGWHSPEVASAETRLLGFSFWEVFVYLLNAALFILIGLQLPPILTAVGGDYGLGTLIGLAALVTGAVIAFRIVWMFTVPYLIRMLDRRSTQVVRRVGPRERFVVGWSGMRGSVSLAAALALPIEGVGERGFPDRDLIVFLTFIVILVTLVVQGLSLPAVIRRLVTREDDQDVREELQARLGAAKAALAKLEELADEDWTRPDTIDRLRGFYEYRSKRFAARGGMVGDYDYEDRSLAYQRLTHELLVAQRHAIVRMRNEGVISSEVMRRVERDLDLEESRLEI